MGHKYRNPFEMKRDSTAFPGLNCGCSTARKIPPCTLGQPTVPGKICRRRTPNGAAKPLPHLVNRCGRKASANLSGRNLRTFSGLHALLGWWLGPFARPWLSEMQLASTPQWKAPMPKGRKA